MDRTEAITKYFYKAVAEYIPDPVRVTLYDGPGGLGLRGMVGWDGTGWDIHLDRNIGRAWVFWCTLWHEAAHVVHGDTPKKAIRNNPFDLALIAGTAGEQREGREKVWNRARDAEIEARCDAWGLAKASQWLPALNEYLESRADEIIVTTAEDRKRAAGID